MLKTLLLTAGLLLIAVSLAFGELPETAPSDQIERGRYLAMSVAKCVECHSPHNRKGDLEPTRLFSGQAIPFTSPFPEGPKWAFQAPAIKRLPGWSTEAFVTLLMTGRRPNGRMPSAPMPQFQMSREDAEAIAAYLKSL